MAIRTLIAKIEGVSPYSQSKAHDTPFLEKESHDDYDRRTWRQKAHTDKAGNIVIPAMSFKWAIAEAGRRLGLKVPGKRGQTYSKLILSGIIVTDNASTGIHITSAREEVVYANADGIRGSGRRVFRRFPLIDSGWTTSIEIHVIDDELPESVVEKCLAEAGNLIGLGRFRPERGGYLGRFDVLKTEWHQQTPRRLVA